jgi:hypothetical protein
LKIPNNLIPEYVISSNDDGDNADEAFGSVVYLTRFFFFVSENLKRLVELIISGGTANFRQNFVLNICLNRDNYNNVIKL